MKAEQRNIEILKNAIAEAARFQKAAMAAINRLSLDDRCYQRKETASAKRSALDLKRVLTEVNQMKAF